MTVRFDGQDVAAGTKTWVEVPVAVDAGMQPITLRACVVNGSTDGPTLWLQGNVHGDEAVGGLAVRDFALDLDPASLEGTVVAIPVANPLDFTNKERATRVNNQGPRDAGRAFPGDSDGSFAAQLAARLFDLAVEHADLVVEAHSPDKELRIEPGFAGVAQTEGAVVERTAALARAIDLPNVIEFPRSVGSGFLFAELNDRGIPGVMMETGSGAERLPWAYDAYRRALANVAREAGLLSGEPSTSGNPDWYDGFAFVTAHAGGFVELSASNGDVVTEGDELGRVTSLEGDVEEVVQAPDDGVVVGRRTYPVIRPGDAVVELATDRR